VAGRPAAARRHRGTGGDTLTCPADGFI
jgi:hypothetical protein